MKATIQFIMEDGNKWAVTNFFSDSRHLKNFINYIERTKNAMLDETFIHKTT